MSTMTNSTQSEQKHTQGDSHGQSTSGDQKLSRPSLGGESYYPSSSGSSNSNFSTESIAYHPSNLRELSAMVRSPTRGFYSGTSLLYSTSGFDMLSVIARVGKHVARIQPKSSIVRLFVYQVTRPNPVVNLGPVGEFAGCSQMLVIIILMWM
jgi:hypothetical protein